MKKYFLIIFLFLLPLVSAGSLTLSNENVCRLVQDDPDITVNCLPGANGLTFSMVTSKPGGFGVYTTDLTKNHLPGLTHGKHGSVRQLYNPSQIVSNGNAADFSYTPTTSSAYLYFGDSTEIVEVVNESKVVYTEDNGLEYNTTLLRCDAEGLNCSIQPADIQIVSNGPSTYKFGAYDNTTGSGSSWYQYQVKSSHPLIYKYGSTWAARIYSHTTTKSLGTWDYYDDYDIDFSGASAYDLDDDDTTFGNLTWSYETDDQILYVNFYSNGTIDPFITQSVTGITNTVTFTGTRDSRSDSAIALNSTLVGSAYVNQELAYTPEANITNITITSYQDLSCGNESQFLWRFQDGSGASAAQDCGTGNDPLGLTNTTWVQNNRTNGFVLEFDGSSEARKDPGTALPTVGGGTYCVWIYPHTNPSTAPAGRGNLIEVWKSTSNLFYFGQTTSGTLRTGGGGSTTGSIAPALNKWTFVCASFDQTDYYVYVNGTYDISGGSGSTVTELDDYRIGRPFNSADPFDGLMSSPTWIFRNVTATEIQKMYDATKANYVDAVANVTATVHVSGNNVTYTACPAFGCNANYTEVNFSFTSDLEYYSEYVYNYTIGYENASGGGPAPDTTNPSVTGLIPNASDQFDNGTTIEIGANVTDDVAVQNVTINVTRSDGTSTTHQLLLATGNFYNASYSIPQGPLGRYNVSFFANDTSGNLNNTETTWFNVTSPDLTPPTITAPRPTDGYEVNNNTFLSVNATVTDNVIVESVNVTITISNGSTVFLPMTLQSGSFYNATYLTPNFELGRYNYTIRASDNVSNEATHTGWFNVTNSTAPVVAPNTTITVTLTSPANNSNVTSLTPTFSWVYTHGDAVTGNCTLFVNNTLGGDTSCTSGVTTNLVVNHSLINLTSYTWFVRARAGANETNSSTFNFTVNIPAGDAGAGSGGTTAEIAMIMSFFIIIWVLIKLSNSINPDAVGILTGIKVGLGLFAYAFSLLVLNIGRQIAVANDVATGIISMFNTAWTIGITITIMLAGGIIVWLLWTIMQPFVEARKERR